MCTVKITISPVRVREIHVWETLCDTFSDCYNYAEKMHNCLDESKCFPWKHCCSYSIREKLYDFRFHKKPDDSKGNYLSGIEKRVREAVREEMVQLMTDGVLSPSSQNSPQQEKLQVVSKGTSPNKRGLFSYVYKKSLYCFSLLTIVN